MKLIDKLNEHKETIAVLRGTEKQGSEFTFLGHHLLGFQTDIDIVKEHNYWLSVNERLPNDGDIVLVYRDSYKWGDLIWQCLYTESKGFRNYPVDGIGKNEKITHWKPIQPPSEV